MNTRARLLTPLLCLSAAAIAPLAAQAPGQPHPAPAHTATAGAARACLGVVTDRISEDLRHQLPNLKPGAGLIVRQLLPDSAAAKANVTELDILLQWNDQMLVHPSQLQVLVASAKPGDQVTLEFIHRGTVTKTQVTLGERPQEHPQAAVQPPLFQHPLLTPEMVGKALQALGESGIDPQQIGEVIKGLNLENIDPEMINQALKGIDLNAIAKALDSFQGGAPAAPGAAAPNPSLPAKVVIIAADGTRTEIPLGEAFKPGGKPADALKHLDLSKLDPAAILSGKILLIQPDGTQQELNPAELLMNSEAINELLKGLSAPR